MIKKKLKNAQQSEVANQNDDGSYTIEWDRNDPEWKWLNNLTSKEIEGIVEQAIKFDKQNEDDFSSYALRGLADAVQDALQSDCTPEEIIDCFISSIRRISNIIEFVQNTQNKC